MSYPRCDFCGEQVLMRAGAEEAHPGFHFTAECGHPNDWIHLGGTWTCRTGPGGTAQVNGSFTVPEHLRATQGKEPIMEPEELTIEQRVELAVQPYRTTLERIARALLEEAEEREWCSEYTEFVDNVNSHIPPGIPRLLPMRRPYRIEFTINCNEQFASALEAKIDDLLGQNNIGSCESYEYDTA